MFKKLMATLAMFYAAASFAAVDINTATAADLDSVKGIGPGMSTRILDERKKGHFKDWNDLIARVKGIGDQNAAKFSASGMTVNGAVYANAPAAAAKPAKPAKATGKEKAAPASAPAPAPASAPAVIAKPAAATTKPAQPAKP